MKDKYKNPNLLLLIMIAVFFGLAAGIAGGLITRSYVINDIYSVPFYGKINFSSDKLRKANFIIENAKNITVEQDKKVNETINSTSGSIVGIFKKKEVKEEESEQDELEQEKKEFDLDQYYKMDNNIAEGLIVTSDGWVILTDFGSTLSKDFIFSNYVVVTKEKEIYKIDDLVREAGNNFLFIHMEEANDLPVREFAFKKSLNNGQLVIALDWEKNSFLTYVLGREREDSMVRSSDLSGESIIFADDLSLFFDQSFIFNLNGDLVALLDKNGDARFVDYFNPIIKNLLKKEEKGRPTLGVNYIELSEFAIKDNKHEKGALIQADRSGVAVVSGSPADEAGLRQGDIITSIDNVEINKDNDLTSVIQKHLAGDEISLVYVRDGQENRIDITLGELK